jgi:uncharacterized protein (DUF362 family)
MAMDRRTFLQVALGTAAIGCAGTPKRLTRGPLARVPGTVAAVRSADFGSYREALEAVVEKAGGLGFIGAGQSVMLKPATNSGNAYPATTDPETVLVMAELVKEQGGVPFVADRSMIGRATRDSFKTTGIADAAAQAGISARHLEADPAVGLKHASASHWARHTIQVARSAAEADHIISLCSPRTHVLGDFTMSLKNGVGLVDGSARVPMHVPMGLKERLAEISLVVRPSFIVLDGRKAFVSGGPDSGDLARPGVLLAGRDPVAIDAVGLAQLRIAGSSVGGHDSIWAIPQLARAAAIGVGVSSAKEITLVGFGADQEAEVRKHLG